MGSSAAKRFPTLQTCHPTHSAFQCSTTEKTNTQLINDNYFCRINDN